MSSFWIHFLDILVGTLVLRMVLGWLLTYPRLVRLLLMLAALLILGFLVRWAELPFSGVFFWILLAPISVVVLLSFLPEMGKIYQSASRGNLFGNVRNKSEELIPVLVETLLGLVRLKQGALLVLPSSKDAEGLIQGGEEVDARINTSLLLSIFNPQSPRHDGAAVIIHDRIRRVGAFLPLASAEGREADLGTRHLAALGLTRLSDAHVLVVSEERQVISYAHDGRLSIMPSQNPAELKKSLQQVLGQNPNQDSGRRLVIFTTTLWLGCLLLATIGSLKIDDWKSRMMENSSVLTYVTAKVEQSPISKDYFVDELKPKEVTLQMRAPQLFKPLGDLTVLVDLREVRAGKYSLNLSEAAVVGLPRDAKIERFDPPAIQYTVAETRKLNIPIDPPVSTGLVESLKLIRAQVEPAVFSAEVRDSKWKPSFSVKPSVLDLGSIRQPGTYRLPLRLNLPPTIKPVEGDSLEAVLVIEVRRK
jgi:diadenylate cyclase